MSRPRMLVSGSRRVPRVASILMGGLPAGAMTDYEWNEETGLATFTYDGGDRGKIKASALHRAHWTHPDDRSDARRARRGDAWDADEGVSW